MIGGVGIDAVDIGRVHALIARHGRRGLGRLFTESERRYCDARAVPEQHYAARIAAKEAAFKALSGTDAARAIGWREIEVQVDEAGRPSIRCHARAASRVREMGVARIWVSLTHADAVAAAVVVLEIR